MFLTEDLSTSSDFMSSVVSVSDALSEHALIIALSSYTHTGPRAPGQLTGQTREAARVTVRLMIVECACAVDA